MNEKFEIIDNKDNNISDNNNEEIQNEINDSEIIPRTNPINSKYYKDSDNEERIRYWK